MQTDDLVQPNTQPNTQPSVLVAYSSKYGATAEIAEQIGAVLHRAGLAVSVLRADLVPSLDPYQAVVLGSAVYAGQWMREAAHLLETEAPALATRPVWLFSSGPTGHGNPVEQMHGWRFPEGLRSVAEQIGPRDIAFFHGCIDRQKLHLGERLLIAALRAEVGDFRNWALIGTWAEAIAVALVAPANPEAEQTAPTVAAVPVTPMTPVISVAKQAL
jgi:menaquinone-dependent protoporphyrinogen oxidase